MTPGLDPVADALEAEMVARASLVRKALIGIADAKLAGLVRPSLRAVALYGSNALLVQIAAALNDHAVTGMVIDRSGNIGVSEGFVPAPQHIAPEGRSL